MRRSEIAISKSLFKDLPRNPAVQFQPFRLFVLFIPSQPKPLQACEYRIHRSFCVAFEVSVIQAQNQGAVMVACIQPVENECASAAHVQKSGGRRSKTHSWSVTWSRGVGHHRRTPDGRASGNERQACPACEQTDETLTFLAISTKSILQT